MLGRWLGDFMTGYVTIYCYGGRIPELINSAIQNNILIWDINRLDNGVTQLTTLRKHIPELRQLARHARIKFRFGNRVGVPFFIGQVVRRKLFLFGFIAFAAGLYMLSSLVWSIEIDGTKRISPETVQAAAESVGIHKWQWKGNLPDTDILQARMLEKLPEMSVVLVSIHGTQVRIQVDEKVAPTVPEITGPQNIIATKNGTIRDIRAVKGKPAVKRGQYVQRGDVLIDAAIGDGKTLVSAKGDVLAEVWYTSVVHVPLKVTQDSMTGAKITKDYLTFGGKSIQIWGYGQSPFASSTPKEYEYKWTWRGFTLPIQFVHVDYFETYQTEIRLTPAEAKQRALQSAQADAAAQTQPGSKILEQLLVTEPQVQNGIYTAKILTKVEEKIGAAQALN